MRPPREPRRRPSAEILREIGSDLAILGGCGAIAGAAWLVDFRLGLLVGGLITVALGYWVIPRGG